MEGESHMSASFKDQMPSQNGWIHDLAKAEVHPDAEKLLQLGRSFDPQQLVEESAIDFLDELKGQFQEHAKVFNAYSEGGSRFTELKVYQLAQTAADFMVYRNQIKLVVSNTAHGVIQISFTEHVRGTLAVDGKNPHEQKTAQGQDLLAQVGAFREIYWTFQGEKVTADQVARYYFAEFVRMTRGQARSRTNNQLLLDQIKTLLEEKGLQF